MTTEETNVPETEVVIVEVPTPTEAPLGTRASLKALWNSVGTTTKMVAAAVTGAAITAALVAKNGSEGEDTDENDPFAFDTSDDES